LTRRADPSIRDTLAHHLQLRADACYLDLACGMGNDTCALAARGGQWRGLDISARMLEQARGRSARIAWLQGDASALPFAPHRFDGVVCTLAIHHFPDLEAAFAEVARVLASGTFVIFTAFAEQMQHYWLGHNFPRMMQRSIEKMPTCAVVLDALHAAGFSAPQVVPFHVTNELQDGFLYSGKHRPGLYLHATARANDSSFAALCPPQELHHGRAALRADIESDRFGDIAARHADETGDYAFVFARKPAGRG
jgi:ubiquinone/menaquinone biosynthesis C-methylase UbiE